MQRVLVGRMSSNFAYHKKAVLTDFKLPKTNNSLAITIFSKWQLQFKLLAVYPSQNPGAIRREQTSQLPVLCFPTNGMNKYNGLIDEIISECLNDPF
jgi:hypothetical protein